ncbi:MULTISPECIES: TetR/AcrR family transcriptional regulator [Gordonia]|uniref:TetR family transcriptional regulator n=2 Tax=Gordonia TaxID=2053 RepID=L7LLG6_9ACTN|nr:MULTISPECIES: hypothetical protein [Gordonia]AUH69197.1 TetR family transcriptional regulator [Gordonia sp. YC-JH1]KJR08164.1 TetR family transcriptional regulator [Gordonia sihwensis]KXT57838.1 TetR family transcriptional regulator [Gordonia sp. QH-12]GAC60898.1 hypothetical protein GSI01S_13_00810 [Gordonia sihwensis NBRC 108236]
MSAVPDLTPRTDRREAICEAALDLAAAGGNRAVTHSAVDRTLDLPKGSTSYYFRTRAALLGGAIAHLTRTSRAAFHRVSATAESSGTSPGTVIADYLHHLTGVRMRDVRARYALAPDAAEAGTATALSECLFSRSAAIALFAARSRVSRERGADDLAEDLMVFCEGVTALAYFSGTVRDARELRDAIGRYFPDLVQ